MKGIINTRDRIVQAALREINNSDFFSTDTNKIAREAGFAPATFYKHFRDKHEVFLEVYRLWYESQRLAVRSLIDKLPTSAELPFYLVESILPQYTHNPGFRLSVRVLAERDQAIQDFRSEHFEENMRLMNLVMKIYKLPAPSRTKCFSFILQMERLCDAIALGEFNRMQIPEVEAKKSLEKLFAEFFTDHEL